MTAALIVLWCAGSLLGAVMLYENADTHFLPYTMAIMAGAVASVTWPALAVWVVWQIASAPGDEK